MALDSEEFKRRRKQREVQRRIQRLRQRKLVISLLIAAAVLLLCGLVIAGMSRRSEGQPADTATDSVPEPTEAVSVIHFVAAGDLNVTDQLVASGGEDFDYTKVFQDVMPILAGADLTTVNLEGVACGGPYGEATRSVPAQLLEALSRAGVDMVQMANSYCLTQGFSGLGTTLRAIRDAGMEPLGAYTSNEEASLYEGYSVFEVKGVRVGVIAMTKGMGGMSMPTGNAMCVNLLYEDYDTTYQTVDTERLTYLLENMAQEKPDVVIALVHWGSEFNDSHSKSQEKIRRLLLEGGVDAIVGTHPHYVQAISQDPDTGAVVAYSLGDFVSGSGRSGTEYSILLDLEITKDHGDTRITGYTYTPIYTVVEDGKVRVMRIQETVDASRSGEIGGVSKEICDSMIEALEKIEKRVTPKKE